MTNQVTNYLLILIGGVIAIYAQATEKQNVVTLIIGIVILMFGVFRIARTIPSKRDDNQDDKTL